MLNLPGEVHFWTSKDDICIPETDFGAFRYHEKKEATESLYLESKKSYASGRGITWAVSNKKSSTVKKEALRDFEEQLTAHRVVRCEWRRHDALQVLLSSGLLVTVRVNLGTGDIVKISNDKYLLGKLPSECLTDVAYGQTHVLLAFSDAVLGMVHLGRPHVPAPEKLARQEAKLLTFDLGGPSGRRLERKLSLSADETMVLAWWRCAQDEVYPWSPIVRDCDRANLLVYSIAGSKLELLCFYKTEGDPISVMFSKQHSNVILLVEQRVSRKGEVSVESSTFEVAASGRLLRSPTVGALQLQTQACCVARSPDETRLALGCIDGSVLLHSPSSTLLAKAAFIPSMVAWHPDGSLVVVANEKGQLQSFDLALAPVRIQLLSEEAACTASILDLTTYFRYQPTLSFMVFNKKPVLEEFNDPYAPSDGYLLMQFERGPLAVLRLVGGGGLPGSLAGFSPDTLVSQYLRLDLVDCAINLLGTLSWDAQGAICLACMHRICNHLLALPLSTAVEEQLEAALGTFMSPSVPLSLAAERQFGRTMHHLARRFFHQLLRYQRFEKSFRLAIDLGDRDLFMDLFHSARGVGDETLAQAARQKASEVDEADTGSGSTSSACECSRSSCSECGSVSSSSSSDSDLYPDPAVLAKPTKVTFSDTVTHIVDVSSGEEDDGDDEDDEVQALIVSDAPLCTLPGRPAHARADQRPAVPQYNPVPRSSSHSELLISNSMSFSSFSSASNKIPINLALYTSSSSYLAHLPGTFSPKSSSNPAYYSVESGPSFTAISYASTPSLTSTNSPRYQDAITRNSELRSSLSSMVPPQKVHQASITSCNKLLPAQTKKPATDNSSVPTMPQTAHNVSRTYVSNISTDVRNPSPRNDAHMSRKDGPVTMRNESHTSRNEGVANTSLRNDSSAGMSPSLRNEGPVYLSRNEAITNASLRKDGSATMNPSPRNDAHMSRKDGPTPMSPSARNEGSVYTSRNEGVANTSFRKDGPVIMSPSLRNDSLTNTSPSLRNEGPVYTSRDESSANTSLRKDGPTPMSPSLRNDSLTNTSPSLRNVYTSRNESSANTSVKGSTTMNPSLRNDAPMSRNIANTALRSDGPTHISSRNPLETSLRNDSHTSRNDSPAHRATTSLQQVTPSGSKMLLPLLDAGAKCKSMPPLTVKPLIDSRNENGLPLLSLNSSPLYLSPFPPTSQRENNSNPPLFKISSVDLRSRPLPDAKDGRPQCNPQLIGDPHTSGLPSNLRDKVVLRKFGTEAALEEEESVTNIKVVHFGVV